MVFELRNSWLIATFESGFDAYTFHSHVVEISQGDDSLKRLVNHYLYLLVRFHFIEHYLTSTIENTVQESYTQLSKRGVKNAEIEWFIDINLRVLFDDASRPKLKDIAEVNPPTDSVAASQPKETENPPLWKTVEAANSIGLIPIWLLPWIGLLGYWLNASLISGVVYLSGLTAYFMMLGLTVFWVGETTSYLPERPWLKVFWVSIIVSILLVLVMIIGTPWLFERNPLNQIISLTLEDFRIGIELWLIYVWAVYAFMNAIYYYWFDDDYGNRFMRSFATIIVYIIGIMITLYWTQNEGFEWLWMGGLMLSTSVQLIGLLVYRFKPVEFVLILSQFSVIFITYFLYVREIL